MTDILNNRTKTYMQTARLLLAKGDIESGRQYLLAMLEERAIAYKEAVRYVDRARILAEIQEWFGLCVELREKGLTDRIKRKLSLGGNVSEEDKGKKAPEADDAPYASPIDDILRESEYHGWCARIFDEYNEAVGAVVCHSKGVNGKTGTGFVISQKGYVLTNDHVVFCPEKGDYYDDIRIHFGQQKVERKLHVLYSSKKHDVAVCKLDSEPVPCRQAIRLLVNYDSLKQGDDVLVIGNGLNMGLAPFTGVIRYIRNQDGLLVYTAPSNPGDSGGPVLNIHGKCIGINSSMTIGAAGHTNAVTSETVLGLLSKWKIDL